jgi:hypothetical protein
MAASLSASQQARLPHSGTGTLWPLPNFASTAVGQPQCAHGRHGSRSVMYTNLLIEDGTRT